MAGNIASTTDFTGNLLADSGVTVVRSTRTKIILSDGTEQLIYNSEEVITAFVNPKINEYTAQKQGFDKETTGYIMVGPTQDINKDDLIVTNDQTFLVLNVKQRNNPFGNINVYKFCEIKLYKDSIDSKYILDNDGNFISQNNGEPVTIT